MSAPELKKSFITASSRKNMADFQYEMRNHRPSGTIWKLVDGLAEEYSLEEAVWMDDGASEYALKIAERFNIKITPAQSALTR